jgi:hypothetical protein
MTTDTPSPSDVLRRKFSVALAAAERTGQPVPIYDDKGRLLARVSQTQQHPRWWRHLGIRAVDHAYVYTRIGKLKQGHIAIRHRKRTLIIPFRIPWRQ